MDTHLHVVFGRSVDGLSTVYIERPLADDLARTRRVLDDATTWGELRAGLTADRYLECVDRADTRDGHEPDDNDAFEAHELAGFADGDWPEWPATEHLHWMPDEAKLLGKREPTVLNDDILEFDPANDSAVVAALERAGYVVTEDNDAVAAALGMAGA
ncbi:hypothetical protein DSM112329_04729 [Paraconexibacter sp. AEG42_29]|uniref:Uncharacterized protein n=2 Tax=Paraconexibacter sp. AEG42_29 TaxID=2997339 RepID=A0AAU7B1K6_9ACTN